MTKDGPLTDAPRDTVISAVEDRRLDSKHIPSFENTFGVPQGSNLDALLFSCSYVC